MKIAIVTGASSGIGKEFTKIIDDQIKLDEIWVFARREDRLNELKKTCKTPVKVFPWDLSKEESYTKFEELLKVENPEIHILVNNAGYGLFGTFEKMGLVEQLGIIQLNDKTLTALCLLSLPYMKNGDSIINIGSNSSWQPVPYQAVYGASKAYVLSFSRALGRELKTRGVHVMCVCPGWIKTEFMDTAVRDDTIQYYDRWYTPEQVAVQAMKDLKKHKKVSILGFPVKFQSQVLVKHLPTDFIMNTWCKQQKKK